MPPSSIRWRTAAAADNEEAADAVAEVDKLRMMTMTRVIKKTTANLPLTEPNVYVKKRKLKNLEFGQK